MKNYDNPKMFRDEADSLERFVLSHQFLKPYLDSYNIHMAKYFLSGEYECRKKALYFKKKNTIVLVVQCVQKNALQKYKQTKKLDLY